MKKIIKLILILSWMGLIFLFSNDTSTASTKKSDGIIIKTAEIFTRRTLNKDEKEKLINKLVVPVRKTAHFLVYLILGILVLNLLKEFNISKSKSIILTIVICCLYACSDEFHQLFISGRSGNILDIIIDTLGSYTGCFIYLGINKLLNKEKVYE